MDEARRVSSRERANQSNQDVKQPLSSPTAKERGTMSPAGIEPTFKFTSENLTFITTQKDK
jgi:hypothetical protein